MQTFKASDSDNPKKPEYKPFLPEDALVDTSSAETSIPTEPVFTPGPITESTTSDPFVPVQGFIPTQPPMQPSGMLPSQDGVAETFFYQPEHVYYPPTPQQFAAGHAGMDRRKFRSLVLGFLFLALAGFIFIIILFGRRGSHDYFAQQNNIADVIVSQPVYEQVIAPPFQVIGKARGYWYGDEGQFPIQVFDKKNNPVAFGFAIAQGEVVDENDFIPFQAIVHDYQFWPTKKKGYITLQRPDVSPEMATVYTIPIEFKKQKGSYVIGAPIVGIVPDINTQDSSSNTTDTTTTTTTSTSNNTTNTLNSKSCANGQDDDQDGLYDTQDPECHYDFNAFNFNSYNPGGRELDAANIKPEPVVTEETSETIETTNNPTTPVNTGGWNQVNWVQQYSN